MATSLAGEGPVGACVAGRWGEGGCRDGPVWSGRKATGWGALLFVLFHFVSYPVWKQRGWGGDFYRIFSGLSPRGRERSGRQRFRVWPRTKHLLRLPSRVPGRREASTRTLACGAWKAAAGPGPGGLPGQAGHSRALSHAPWFSPSDSGGREWGGCLRGRGGFFICCRLNTTVFPFCSVGLGFFAQSYREQIASDAFAPTATLGPCAAAPAALGR